MRTTRALVPLLALVFLCSGEAESSPRTKHHDLAVRVFMVRDLLTGGIEPASADIVFRNEDGKITFSGTTDKNGHLQVPVDPRALRPGERLEATIGSGSPLYFGAIVGVTPGRSDYELFLPPLKSMTRPDSINVETGRN